MISIPKVILSLFLILFMVGCATPPHMNETPLGRNWGRSYVSQIYLQKANPVPIQNFDPILGLAGDAAAINRNEYLKSFAEKQKRTTYSIDLTGLGK